MPFSPKPPRIYSSASSQQYAVVAAMASSSYFDEEEPSEPFHCTICMTELPRWPADACTLQPCGHHFHLECATRWMDRELPELQSWRDDDC